MVFAGIDRFFPKGEFSRNVLTLAIGTTIAQTIPIAASPILTRLYTPEDFGVLALYVAIVGIISPAATARYELAVMLPEKDEDADALVVLSASVAAVLSLFVLLIVILFNRPLANLFGTAALTYWLYAVPLGIFLVGAYNSLNYWLNRHQRYTTMSENRILQNCITVSTNLGLGWAKVGSSGLISGTILGQAVTTAMFGKQFLTNRQSPPISRCTFRQGAKLAVRYKNHPMHLLPAQWIGAGALQIPVFLISRTFGSAICGFYSLGSRMISMPCLLIANAIGDVYRQRATVLYREAGQFRRLFLETLTKSIKIGVLPFLALFVLAPALFAFVFGEPWRVAGDYARILSIASFCQFVFTPIDKGALIVGATRYIFFWHLARLLSIVAMAAMTTILKWNSISFVSFLVIINTTLYLVDGFMNYRFSRGIRLR